MSSNRAARKQKEAELLELTKKGVITLEEYTERIQQTDTAKQSKVGHAAPVVETSVAGKRRHIRYG